MFFTHHPSLITHHFLKLFGKLTADARLSDAVSRMPANPNLCE
jgi:hypothetical protein